MSKRIVIIGGGTFQPIRNHLGDFGDIKAVFLEKHGINMMFKRTTKSEDVIEFLKNNIELGVKIK
tara:strand:- start:12475 stop:12669 length:195 start_codon:yes stop_codon:yes gene_type:complete